MFVSIQLNLFILRQGEEGGRSAEGSATRTSGFSLERAILAGGFPSFWSLYMLNVVNGKERKKRSGQYLWAAGQYFYSEDDL